MSARRRKPPATFARRDEATARKMAAIVERVRVGVPLATAASGVGVAADTARGWRQRGLGEDADRPPWSTSEEPGSLPGLYGSFALSLALADAEAETHMIELVTAGAVDDPRIALQWLRVRWQGRYGNRPDVDEAPSARVEYRRPLDRPSEDTEEHVAGLLSALADAGIQTMRLAVRRQTRDGSAVPPLLVELAERERAAFVEDGAAAWLFPWEDGYDLDADEAAHPDVIAPMAAPDLAHSPWRDAYPRESGDDVAEWSGWGWRGRL